MVFYPPSWVPQMREIPDECTIPEFMFNPKYGRLPIEKSLTPFVCGLTGETRTTQQLKDRTEWLASGLAQDLGWAPNKGSEWDKVIGLFSSNSIDYITASWAAHRLNGISTPANAQYNASELAYQFKHSGAKAVFTDVLNLQTTIDAAKEAGIDEKYIYLIKLPEPFIEGKKAPAKFKTMDQLIEAGKKAGAVEQLKWEKGQGKKQTAFLCYSSGTSGLPKGVMISHYNVISNVIQEATYDSRGRNDWAKEDGVEHFRDIALGLLPFSHIYGLVLIVHASVWRGDQVVVLPKFLQQAYFEAIHKHRCTALYLVPPIIIMMTNNKEMCKKYDLNSVKCIFTGAAPLTKDTADELNKIFPSWKIRQGYGMTESSTLTSSTSPHDIDFGSSGSLIPGVKARLVSPEDGGEITGYDQPGELLLQSPSVTLGYLNNDKANKETYQDGWLRTGDEAVFRKSPQGNEHLFITDRIKELIKVKGLQVAPAELEGHLLAHPAVADCTVIPVPDDRAGEVPKAFVVKAPGSIEENDAVLKRDIKKWVEKHKSKHKWLEGGVEFIDAIPKSPSGKILRRMLRDKEKEKRRKAGAKL